MTSAATKSVSAGTHSFVPSLSPEEMAKLDIKRVPQNAGETVEMQVRCHVMLSSACECITGAFICIESIYEGSLAFFCRALQNLCYLLCMISKETCYAF